MKTTIIATLTIGLIVLSACKKCAECHYDSPNGEVEIGEYCKDDLEAVEANGHYDSTNDTTYEVHCSEH